MRSDQKIIWIISFERLKFDAQQNLIFQKSQPAKNYTHETRLRLFKKCGINRGKAFGNERAILLRRCVRRFIQLHDSGHRENTPFVFFLAYFLPRCSSSSCNLELLLYTHFRREGETAFKTEKIETLRFDDCDQHFNSIFACIFITKKRNK